MSPFAPRYFAAGAGSAADSRTMPPLYMLITTFCTLNVSVAAGLMTFITTFSTALLEISAYPTCAVCRRCVDDDGYGLGGSARSEFP